MKKVSIITVNYRQADYTVDFLSSLSKSTYKNLEVIVVENGMVENNDDRYARVYPGIKILHSTDNLGFAGGNNLGIQIATGDYVFFLNNDTEVPADTIEKLVHVMETNEQLGVLCPRIYYHDHPDTLQFAGYTSMNWITARNSVHQFRQVDKPEDKLTESPFAHGAAMMVRKYALDQVGMMPESYFLYYEELDWTHQFRQKGYELGVYHGAYILHKESITTGKSSPLKTYFQTRNRILFMRRNGGSRKWLFYLFFAVVVLPIHSLRYISKQQWQHMRSLLAGTWWNVINSSSSKRLGFIYDSLKSS